MTWLLYLGLAFVALAALLRLLAVLLRGWHVCGRYLRLAGPSEEPLFSERYGYTGRVPLGFGWRVIVRPDTRQEPPLHGDRTGTVWARETAPPDDSLRPLPPPRP